MLLWTINDYPAYGLVSGQQHSGYRGCVVCGPNCEAQGSKALKKLLFVGHRRWLPQRHHFRNKEVAKYFDGTVEARHAPSRVSSCDWKLWGEKAIAYVAEKPGNRLDNEESPVKENGVKRVTELYKLPYWSVSNWFSMPNP